jgi:hypothetical protein
LDIARELTLQYAFRVLEVGGWKMADDDFLHDLIIATDGEIYRIPPEKWQDRNHIVPHREYEYDEGDAGQPLDPQRDGTWQVLRELLQCGAVVAVVPKKLPPGKPKPRGTCYVLNLAAFNRSNRYHVK